MKITLTRNIGTDDLRKFGVLADGGDPAALRTALDTYAKGRTVDVPEHFHEYLIKRGLGESTDEPLSPAPVKGVAKKAALTAPAVAPAHVTAPAQPPKPETFSANPNEPGPKKDK